MAHDISGLVSLQGSTTKSTVISRNLIILPCRVLFKNHKTTYILSDFLWQYIFIANCQVALLESASPVVQKSAGFCFVFGLLWLCANLEFVKIYGFVRKFWRSTIYIPIVRYISISNNNKNTLPKKTSLEAKQHTWHVIFQNFRRDS